LKETVRRDVGEFLKEPLEKVLEELLKEPGDQNRRLYKWV
jgi:CRISPR/Cas system CSM-associated protein Csm2 small subunit